MMNRLGAVFALALFTSGLGAAGALAQDWPQGTGPLGTFGSTGPEPPAHYSVRSGENILWRTPLPETGQGGIAAVGDRLFVATMAPWDPETGTLSPEEAERFAHAVEKRTVVGKDIDAHCVDADTGKVLWTRRLEGSVPSIYSYPFSDATSASPVADGEHVWFTNAGGLVVCFTTGGEEVWRRSFDPTIEGPFNKQFEPFLVEDGGKKVLVHMEPFERPSSEAAEGSGERWHHLVGLDAKTGELLWKSDDALTHYNAPTLVAANGTRGPGLLIARGGPHAVPERPVGLSLVHLTGEQRGESAWRFEDPRARTVKGHEAALNSMAHDETHAYWLLKEPANALVMIDLETGEESGEISLTEGVTRTVWDPESRTIVTEAGVDLELGVMPARYTTLATGRFQGGGPLDGRAAFSGGDTSAGLSGQTRRYVLFQCYATAWGKPTLGSPYSLCRIDPDRRLVEYLEVPTDTVRKEDGSMELLWRTPRSALAQNSRGVEVTGDDRSHWDGWDWVFNGTPTRVNGRVYFTLASGVGYTVDALAAHFDARALLAVNDLGANGQVWTGNSMSYAGGRLYHRTAATLFCIGG